MSATLRWIAAASVILGGWGAPLLRVQAAVQSVSANRVFGQADFTAGTANQGAGTPAANSLWVPGGVALDAQGNLYVADELNNRVLEYNAPLASGMGASRVFGQPDFSHNYPNQGTGTPGANGLWAPGSVALDAQGDLYVADTLNHRVLEYDAPLSSGMAANRVIGQPDFSQNGPNQGVLTPTANSLYAPIGLVLDAQGNLLVADLNNNRVLEYYAPLANGMAANRVFGQRGFSQSAPNQGAGAPDANSLNQPVGVALDALGNLYVADTANNRVLEFYAPLTNDKAATRVFGQPDFSQNIANQGLSNPAANTLNAPYGVALDAQGDLYVADAGNNRALEYDAPLTSGMAASRVFGQPNFSQNIANRGLSNPAANTLDLPSSVALDAQGNLYVPDQANNRVLEYDVPVPYSVPVLSALAPSTVAAGSPSFALTVTGSGFVPGSVVRWNGGDRPTTFVSSTQLEAAISASDLAGGGPFAVTVFTPPPGGGTSSPISLPLYTRAGQDAIADMVQGQPSFNWAQVNNLIMLTSSQLYNPSGVAVDPHSGRLFVADASNNRVLSWSNAAALANAQPADLVVGQPNFLTSFPNTGGLSARTLALPYSVALDGHGNLYVADSGNNRVLEYDVPLAIGMAASRVFGQGGSFTTDSPNNGGISANSLNNPWGVAVDAQGNLYVADTFNNRALEYNSPLSNATANRVFGQSQFNSNTANSSPNGANNLDWPAGLALDMRADLYVADLFNNRVLEYLSPLSSGMAASRVFGQANFTQTGADENGLNASGLKGPGAVAVDLFGDLYVADSSNNRVLEYEPPLASGMAARRVFGQPDFTHNTANDPTLSASSLHVPTGVAVDVQSNLYVADNYNNRVLEYDWALVRVALPLIER